jgi:hypothetical protein
MSVLHDLIFTQCGRSFSTRNNFAMRAAELTVIEAVLMQRGVVTTVQINNMRTHASNRGAI